MDSWHFQRAERARLEATAGVGASAGSTVGRSDRTPAPGRGEAFAILDIPRLGVSVVVADGDDARVLRVAVGHVPGTPWPWESGNSALAGHRDTFFRPLERIRVGDTLRMVTPRGDLLYTVRRTLVVRPEETWVLGATRLPTLTLVTCYPFSFVGRAPRRFVVQAQRADSYDSLTSKHIV